MRCWIKRFGKIDTEATDAILRESYLDTNIFLITCRDTKIEESKFIPIIQGQKALKRHGKYWRRQMNRCWWKNER